MDKIKKDSAEEFVVMRRNAKGQFQKADKSAFDFEKKIPSSNPVKKQESAASTTKLPSIEEIDSDFEAKPEKEIRRSSLQTMQGMPEKEIRRSPLQNSFENSEKVDKSDYFEKFDRKERIQEPQTKNSDLDSDYNFKHSEYEFKNPFVVEKPAMPKPERPVVHYTEMPSVQNFEKPAAVKEPEKKVMTNADRIRSMTDEELAEFLSDVEKGGLKPVKFLRLWLKQEERK